MEYEEFRKQTLDRLQSVINEFDSIERKNLFIAGLFKKYEDSIRELSMIIISLLDYLDSNYQEEIDGKVLEEG